MSEWIKWTGEGEIPTGLVDIKFCNGGIEIKCNSKEFYWGRRSGVVAYRKCEPEPPAQSKLDNLKRYDMCIDPVMDRFEMEEDKTGAWLHYEDVKALLEDL